jgi:hypothetical protein
VDPLSGKLIAHAYWPIPAYPRGRVNRLGVSKGGDAMDDGGFGDHEARIALHLVQTPATLVNVTATTALPWIG